MLANPKKLRVIAESTKKTDRLDAQVLAEFLARDMIPRAYMPTPRQRQHRALVRHRQYLRGRMTSVRCKIRHILADYNADRKDLFSARCGQAYFKEVALSDADRFVIKQLWSEWEDHQARLLALTKKIKAFVAKAPARESGSPGDPQDGPGRGVRDRRGGAQRDGRRQPLRQRQGDLRLRGAGAGGAADRRQEVQGPADHQARLGAVAVGPGGVGLAAGQDQSEVVRLVLPAEEAHAAASGPSWRWPGSCLCVLYAMLKTSTPYKIIPAATPAEPPEPTRKRLVRVSTRGSRPSPRSGSPRPRKGSSARSEPNPASVRASHLSSEGRWA